MKGVRHGSLDQWNSGGFQGNPVAENIGSPKFARRQPSGIARRRELLSAPLPAAPAAVATPNTPYYLPGQPGDGTNQTFVNNVYRELLGRNVDPTGAAYWMNFLAQNTAAKQPLNNGGTAVNDGLGASGFAIGTPALNGAQVEGPNGGYAITEFPQGFSSAAAFPNGNPTAPSARLVPKAPMAVMPARP